MDDLEASDSYKRVEEIPFNSSRKMMLTVTEVTKTKEYGAGGIKGMVGGPSVEKEYIVVVKGAPNIILEKCKAYVCEDGTRGIFYPSDFDEAMEHVDALSSEALRVLAVASKVLPELPWAAGDDEVTADMKFDRLLGGGSSGFSGGSYSGEQEIGSELHPLTLMGLVASIDP